MPDDHAPEHGDKTDATYAAHSQEKQLAELAREFALASRYQEALLLIERSQMSLELNLYTLLSVCLSAPQELQERARGLFEEKLHQFEKAGPLQRISRSLSHEPLDALSEIFRDLVRARIWELEPEWDGVDGEGLRIKKLLILPPEEVTDPEVCLTLSTAVSGDRYPVYIDRYHTLGGDQESERYLRIRLNAIMRGAEPAGEEIDLIERLAKRLGGNAFRKWVRSNSREKSKRGFVLPEAYAKMVLAAYIHLVPEDLTLDDWAYITNRALSLGEIPLQRICFEYLKKMPRNEAVQRDFDLLMEKFTSSEVGETTPHSMMNPAYDPTGRAPISRDAARAASMWAAEVWK